MDIHIVKKVEQPLLGRSLVTAKATFEGATPTRAHLRKDIAKAMHAPEEQVVVKAIRTGFGAGAVVVEATVYAKSDDIAAVEGKHLVARHAPKEKKQ